MQTYWRLKQYLPALARAAKGPHWTYSVGNLHARMLSSVSPLIVKRHATATQRFR